MILEPKHLTPYTPYSLKVIMEGKKCNVAWMSTKNIAVHRPGGIGDYKRIKWKYAHLNIKPILRPLSDLKDIEDILIHSENLNFNPSIMANILIKFRKHGYYKTLPYFVIEYLLKNKYDVFGLIEKGLAIDINTLNHEQRQI